MEHRKPRIPWPSAPGVVGALLGVALLGSPEAASACGCLAPPIPTPTAVSFAVNQQSEVILFEVEPEDPTQGVPAMVTAHVLIRYAGAPEQFAWIVPVASVPELELSQAGAIGFFDGATTPLVGATPENLCPVQEYVCRTHPWPVCERPGGSSVGFGDTALGSPNFSGPAAAPDLGSASGMSGAPPPVTVYQRAQIGSYDTVVFGAGEASAAVDWLNQEGFIVNRTMTPYMQPYFDAGMLFVASKLVPGAGVEEIRPLRMRYAAEKPLIPLRLTAVAAEPHMTVTALIFGQEAFAPDVGSLTTVPPESIHIDLRSGRNNYPMVLSRVIDEAGGDAFVREYLGTPPAFSSGNDFCCQTPQACGPIAGDGQCQCPRSEFDRADCEADPDVLPSIEMIDRLGASYPYLTRLTTRVSPEEMYFDPVFRGDGTNAELSASQSQGRLTLNGKMYNLAACEADIIDSERYQEVRSLEECAGLYCGKGHCAVTDTGAGCVCDRGFVARSFTDLDGRGSVTCVPEVATVDLAAGGIEIPDVCASANIVDGGGCVALAGFAARGCPEGQAATYGVNIPGCAPIRFESDGPGAWNPTPELLDVQVCAPPPPQCSAIGWLEPTRIEGRHGVLCDSSIPDPSWLEKPMAPTCESVAGLGPNDRAAAAGSFNTGSTRPNIIERLRDRQDSAGVSTTYNDNLLAGRNHDEGCAISARPDTSSRSVPLAMGLLGFALAFARRRVHRS